MSIHIHNGDHFSTTYAGDGSALTNLQRGNIAPDTPNSVVINDGTGLLSSVGLLSVNRGGTGTGTVPGNGQILVGDSSVYAPRDLLSDSSINVSNLPGGLQVGVAPSGVVPGSYINTNLTVGADGRVTAASNGVGGSGGNSRVDLLARPVIPLRDESTVASWTFRLVDWTGIPTFQLVFWVEFSKMFSVRVKRTLPSLTVIGSMTVVSGGLHTINFPAPLTDTQITVTLQAEMNSKPHSMVTNMFVTS